MNKPSPIHQSGNALNEAAREAMLEAGEQWTGMREAVFTQLARHEQPVSAYDIADELTTSRGKRVAPNSVYRILDLFVAHNVAVRIESSRAYVASTHPGLRHDCVFLVCEECGGVAHIDDDEMSRSIQALALRVGFQPHRPVLEIRGVCEDCA